MECFNFVLIGRFKGGAQNLSEGQILKIKRDRKGPLQGLVWEWRIQVMADYWCMGAKI